MKLPDDLELAFRYSGWKSDIRGKFRTQFKIDGIEFEVPPLLQSFRARFGGMLFQPVDAVRADGSNSMWILDGIDYDSAYQAVLKWSKEKGNGPWFYLARSYNDDVMLFVDFQGNVVRCSSSEQFNTEKFEVSPIAQSIEEAFERVAFGESRQAPSWLAEAVDRAYAMPSRFKFSAQAEAMLRRNGWFPERHVQTAVFVNGREGRQYAFNSAAREVLESFGGLMITIFKDAETSEDIVDYIVFDPELAAQDPPSTQRAEEEMYGDTPWSPLGTIMDGGYPLMITASGQLIAFPGPCVIKSSFESAMEAILTAGPAKYSSLFGTSMSPMRSARS